MPATHSANAASLTWYKTHFRQYAFGNGREIGATFQFQTNKRPICIIGIIKCLRISVEGFIG